MWPPESWRDQVPAGASKMLSLRPSRLLEIRSATQTPNERERDRQDPAFIVLRQIERLQFTTREEADGMSLEVEVPALTATLCGMLEEVAAILTQRQRDATNAENASGSDESKETP